MCVCIKFEHIRAIRPCPPSHSVPLCVCVFLTTHSHRRREVKARLPILSPGSRAETPLKGPVNEIRKKLDDMDLDATEVHRNFPLKSDYKLSSCCDPRGDAVYFLLGLLEGKQASFGLIK